MNIFLPTEHSSLGKSFQTLTLLLALQQNLECLCKNYFNRVNKDFEPKQNQIGNMNLRPKKSILILLAGGLWNDSRVLKVSQTLSESYNITLWCYSSKASQETTSYKVMETHKNQTVLFKLLTRTLFWLPFHLDTVKLQKELLNSDLIWANDLLTLYTGLKLARKFNAKLVYDSHEIYLETINQFFPSNTTGIKRLFHQLNCRFMQKLGGYLERKISSETSQVFTANDSFTRVLKEKYSIRNISSLYNMPIYNPIRTSSSDSSIRDNFTKDEVIILYHGKFGPGRGLGLIIDSLSFLPDKFRLVLLGSGVSEELLKQRAQKNSQIERVTFIPMVPESNLIEYIKGADIGMNILENINQSKWLASPNKLFQYIHAGLPVVCSRSPENLKAFDNFDLGVLVENFPEAIAQGIIEVYESKKSKRFDKLETAAKYFSWETEKKKLESTISSLMKST